MGSLGHDAGLNGPIKTNPKVDSSYTQKQAFDSQFTPPPSPGNVQDSDAKELQFDNIVPVQDAYETQVLILPGETQALNFDDEPQPLNFGSEPQASNFGDETQALYLGNEPQVLNFGDETQALDFGDEHLELNFDEETQVLKFGGETQALDYLDGVEHLGTQLLDVFDNEVADDSDGEGSDRTELLGGSDDDSARRKCGQSSEKEKKCCPSSPEEDEKGLREAPDALTGEPSNSGFDVSTTTPVAQDTLEPKTGSVPRFTSIRAASLRASGLAARRMDLREANCKSCSALNNGVFSDEVGIIKHNCLEPEVLNEVDQVHHLETDNEKGKGLSGNNCRIGSSTVRKLFSEDSLSVDKGLPNNGENTDGGENLLQLPACDVEVAGLSYIDSQEPGELSQVDALKFVEMFIEKNNFMESDHEVNHGKTSEGKSKPVSTAKGPQNLAKKVNNKTTVGETGIFDWDDNREDEGGGDIFCRRKEEFFGSGSHVLVLGSLTEPQKPRKVKLDVCRDNKEELDVHDEIIVHSDSRVILQNMKKNKKKGQEAKMNFNKSLAIELDEQFNTDSSRGQLEDILSKADMPEMFHVGPDTQMAAEAMEALLFGEGTANHDANGLQSNSNDPAEDSLGVKSKNKVCLKQPSSRKSLGLSDVGAATRQSKKIKRASKRLSEASPVSSVRPSKNVRKDSDLALLTTKRKRAKSTAEKHFITNGGKNMNKLPYKILGRKKIERGSESSHPREFNRSLNSLTGSGGHSIKKGNLSEEVSPSAPIAYRTRHSMLVNKSKTAELVPDDCREEINHLEVCAVEENRNVSTDVEASEVMHAKRKSSKLSSNRSEELEKAKPSQHDQLHLKLTAVSDGIDTLRHPRGRRSHRSLSGLVNGFVNVTSQSEPSIQPEDIRQSITRHKRSQSNAMNNIINLTMKRKRRSSAHASAVDSSEDGSLEGKLSFKSSSKLGPKDASLNGSSVDMNGKVMSTDLILVEELEHSDRKSVAYPFISAENVEMNDKIDKSPRDKCKTSTSACTSPANCMTPVNAASPVCMGNEYIRQSYKKNLSRTCLRREISSLCATEPEPISPLKDLRKRRDMTSIRVLFSQHLDEDIVKQQKKILARLGASVAISITDATHFVTDEFVRTRNMLEAIASGKPVVTHLWLESIGQVKVHIDEDAYLLRDIKKEREFGFSMPVTLARARKLPLLQGRRVLITPNIKPSKETISGLVKAVHGQAVERMGRSAVKDDKVPDDLLILSCEEDYGICEPFLEKGAAVYSSELLLNGIVTQKLEYERHRLFADHVKRTRSTIWLKKDDHKFHPVTKLK